MRKRVLYVSNIQVPYRVRFFNQLAKSWDVTVFYCAHTRETRDRDWANGEKPAFSSLYPRDSGKLLRQLRRGFDAVVIGCYTSPPQIILMGLLTAMGIPYSILLDGEPFLEGRGWKERGKIWLLSSAGQYFVAGERAAESLMPVAKGKPVFPYHFSSLTRQELSDHRQARCRRGDTVLVVGQYYPYKGLDVALEAAARDPNRPYLFVGMGERTERFRRENRIPPNVWLIPFLQKQELETCYRTCALLVLPSRRECWGLVVNEAASFGMPIVSTWGSGAAVEFLAEDYRQYLARPGDGEDLHRCIQRFFAAEDREAYQAYLLEKSGNYYIEENVAAHLRGL